MEKDKKIQFAYCGYDCLNCPVYKETKNNDLEQLRKILYNNNPNETVESLGCYGCKSDKSVNYMCINCLIRKCAIDKEVQNCGLCNSFPCEKLIYISKETMEHLKQIREEKKSD